MRINRILFVLLALWVSSANARRTGSARIFFTVIPNAGAGGPGKMEPISGRVDGAKRGQRIVLFAESGGVWWVQPFASKAFTEIQADSTWASSTHLGARYAALLVEPGYRAPQTADSLPAVGGPVLAAAIVKGAPDRVSFSGYEWDVLDTVRESGGVVNHNDPANVWTDEKGRLHLRASAEISLTRSLGYGRYSFALHEMPRQLDPAAVLGLFTWDPSDADRHHREIDIEISQWGNALNPRNAQFVIQPYEVPENLFRFRSPANATVTHQFEWQPGRVSFRSTVARPHPRVVAEHTFASGIPSPGGERVHINFHLFGKARSRRGSPSEEIVVEKFTFSP